MTVSSLFAQMCLIASLSASPLPVTSQLQQTDNSIQYNFKDYGYFTDEYKVYSFDFTEDSEIYLIANHISFTPGSSATNIGVPGFNPNFNLTGGFFSIRATYNYLPSDFYGGHPNYYLACGPRTNSASTTVATSHYSGSKSTSAGGEFSLLNFINLKFDYSSTSEVIITTRETALGNFMNYVPSYGSPTLYTTTQANWEITLSGEYEHTINSDIYYMVEVPKAAAERKEHFSFQIYTGMDFVDSSTGQSYYGTAPMWTNIEIDL